MSTNETEPGAQQCGHHDPYGFTRFMLIFWGAGTVAVIGLLGNAFLFVLLGHSSPSDSAAGCRSGESSSVYLRFLALLDALICACYLLIFCGDALGVYLEIDWVYIAWTHYSIPVFFSSKVVQLASAYVIISATSERLLLIWRGPVSRRPPRAAVRVAVIAAISIASVGLRASVFAELSIQYFPDCPSNRTQEAMAVGVTALAHSPTYYIFDFYVMFAVQVLLPFLALLVLNVGIVRSLRASYVLAKQRAARNKRHSLFPSARGFSVSSGVELTSPQATLHQCTDDWEDGAEMHPLATGMAASTLYLQQVAELKERRQRRASANRATYMFVFITASYLVCNSVSMLITIMERVPGGQWFLISPEGYPNVFYVVMTDVISFLFMLTSVLRFLIALAFAPQLRSAASTKLPFPSTRRKLSHHWTLVTLLPRDSKAAL